MIVVTCPHCEQPVIITKINCGIFRHGVYKKTGKQIKPHLKQCECERLIKNQLINGCGKPFRVVKKDDHYNSEICDYN